MSAAVVTREVGAADVADLARLFDSQRSTRHCWCTAFCTTRAGFAVGWLTGGNRRRFEAIAAERIPMGILATEHGEPVGWCACGPRSRYVAATRPGSPRRGMSAEVDDAGWLLPCLFVRAGQRGRGVSHALVGAAVELARREGAARIEGWPLAASADRPADAFRGRQEVFADLGFSCVERPADDRVVMRLELAGG